MKFKRSLFIGFALLSLQANAANSAFVNGRVLAGAQADGSGADAGKYAVMTFVRNNIPGEVAHQVAGPDSTDHSLIFSPPHQPSYYLSDAGSQWSSGVSLGQNCLSVAETYSPQHQWKGISLAGAVAGTWNKSALNAAMLSFPDLWLSAIPAPELVTADPSHIGLRVGSFTDQGGKALNMGLWRRLAGSSSWDYLFDLAIPGNGSFAAYDDLSVTAEALYEYSVTINFDWSGGGGAGSQPNRSGIYSTLARSNAGPFAASLHQPTPTPTLPAPTSTATPFAMPQGWLAFPNPCRGDTLKVAFDAEKTYKFDVFVYSIDGAKVLENRGEVKKTGRSIVELGIKSLASGIYLMKLSLIDGKGGLHEYPVHKIAVIK